MNKRRLQDQKQFTAGLLILAWKQDVFKIGIKSLFVSHPKTVSLGAKNGFRVSAKNDSTTGLRVSEIEVSG
jgi:hypothetical protein